MADAVGIIPKGTPPAPVGVGGVGKALAVTYFRMGRPHTNIGEGAFHV